MINTNMFVEAFHRLLKKVYLKGKQNRRLDHCVFSSKLLRTKLLQGHKNQQREINKRHKRGEEMMKNGYDIDQINND